MAGQGDALYVRFIAQISLEVQVTLLGRLQGHLMGYLFLQQPGISTAGRIVLRSGTGRRGRGRYLMPINTVLRCDIAGLQQWWVLRGRGECHATFQRHSRDTNTGTHLGGMH